MRSWPEHPFFSLPYARKYPTFVYMSSDRRIELRIPVEICVHQVRSGEQSLGLTRDLSERGLYVSCVSRGAQPTSSAWLGEQVQLEFALPGTREFIWAQGEVRYAEREGPLHGVGIYLTNMAERHARMMRDYTEHVQRARLQNRLLKDLQAVRHEAPQGPRPRFLG